MISSPYARLVLFLGLMLWHGPSARAQTPHCPPQGYDYRAAFHQVHGYLMKADHWEYFSDVSNYQEVFTSKAQFRQKSRLEIIPVRRFHAPAMGGAPADSTDWAAWFQPDYDQFLALLACDRQVVALLVSSPKPYRRHEVPENMGVDSDVDLNAVSATFYAPGVCLFYDPQLRTYAYVQEGAYVYWNYSLRRFATVRGLSGYRNLSRTGVQ